jgi:protein-serine/threonine kinase
MHTLDLLQASKCGYWEVMEFCAGGGLRTLVLTAGKLEVNEADRYFKQMMRGIEYIHEMGVAHRDMKPGGLLLIEHGSLKITDFGNAQCFRMA